MASPKQEDPRVCENFCVFYKPGRNEALACQGALVLRRLAGRGMRLQLHRRSGAAPLPDGLREALCGACSFRAGDCDFIGGVAGAVPCGGLLALCHLLDEGAVALEDISA